MTFLFLNNPEQVSTELKHWRWAQWARLIHEALEMIIQQGVREGSLRPVDTHVASCFVFSMFHVMLSAYRLASIETGETGADGRARVTLRSDTPSTGQIADVVMDLLMHGLSAGARPPEGSGET
jgi:hypothetical protein